MCYTFVKGMALTAASASSRRAAFLPVHPRSKGIPVTFSPALFRKRQQDKERVEQENQLKAA